MVLLSHGQGLAGNPTSQGPVANEAGPACRAPAPHFSHQNCHPDTGMEAEKGQGMLSTSLPTAPFSADLGRAAPKTQRELAGPTPNRLLPPATQTLPFSLRRREPSRLASLGPSASVTRSELHPPASPSFQPPHPAQAGLPGSRFAPPGIDSRIHSLNM